MLYATHAIVTIYPYIGLYSADKEEEKSIIKSLSCA